MQEQTMYERYLVHSFLFDPNMMINTNILIVGVGGIGCQLLKVLSKSPIGKIHILDMDTIQISNLNRQFLFKVQHKGMSKALVARQSISRLNPYLNITAHHNNIKEMPISFFRQFNFLVMALDNIEARNYVNKIGIRLNIPIIDAGTLAYKGNSRMIIPGRTSCYSCHPKSSTQKSFPVCTIRMRPQKPIHCIVWGKMLFEVFFSHQTKEQQRQQQIEQKAEGDMDDLGQLIKKPVDEIFEQLFNTEIEGIKHAKTEQDSLLSEMYMKKIQPIPKDLIQHSLKSDQQILNLQSFDDFDEKLTIEKHIRIAKLSYMNLLAQKQREKMILFEKDDDMIIHFISSMANIRMKCFSIEDGSLSFNQVKNMAGNIVPAIASTNSIVSGLQVLEMIKFIVYEGNLAYLKQYYVQNQAYKVRGMKVQPPNPECLVCEKSCQPCTIACNFQSHKFLDIISCIKNKLSDIEEYSINAGSRELYNSQQPRQVILNKTLLQLSDGNFQLELILTNQDISQKICSIWLIHSQQQTELQILNEQQLSNRKTANNADKMSEQSLKDQKKEDSQDLVEMDNHDGGDDIVEVVPQSQIQKQNQRHHGKMIDENQEEGEKGDIKKKRKIQ